MKIMMNFFAKTTLILICGFSMSVASAKEPLPEISHDGLVLVKDSQVDIAYVLPGADLGVYNKVMLVKPHIAFKKNWQRDQNQTRRGNERVTDKDMERMISRGKDLFGYVFIDALEENGYPFVSEAGADVLLVYPAIINLDVTAPDVESSRHSSTYSANAGEATLYVELYDSVSGQILARVSDRKVDRNNDLMWSMSRRSSGGSAEATKAFKYWAELLVDALNNAKKSAGG